MCMMLNVPSAIEAEVADYERVTGESLQDMFLSYLESKLAARRVTDEKVMRQKAKLLRCVGTWKDDRSTKEIIADIESHRTMGRTRRKQLDALRSQGLITEAEYAEKRTAILAEL